MGVAPFGYPRVEGYFHLTAAFRRLSRPSSAFSAKAFTLRSFSLEQPSCFSSSKKHSTLFCLSFANNCLGCDRKDLLVFFHVVRLEDRSSKLTKLFLPIYCTEKPFIVSITSFSRDQWISPLIVIQLSVRFFFFIRFSMSICLPLPLHS